MELAASILKLFERQKINKFEEQRVVYKNNRFVALPSCSRALPLHGAPMKPRNVIQKAPKKKRSQSLTENACYLHILQYKHQSSYNAASPSSNGWR